MTTSSSTIKNEDLLALKSYITAADATQYNSLAATTLVLDLTHSNLNQRHAEIRFDKHDTVDCLRQKIHQKTGTPPHMQHLQLKATAGGNIFYEILPEMESERKLGYYNLPLGANVHCVDLDPYSSSAGGAYENTALVEKYKMSDEEYDKRKGTLRDWGRQKKEENPEFSLMKHAKEHAQLVEARRFYKESGSVKEGFEFDESSGLIIRAEDESDNAIQTSKPKSDAEIEYGPESIQHLTLKDRCQVQPGSRRGEIAYIGQIDDLGGGGHWVGVILDEPLGRSDGCVNSVRYFEAPGPNRGGFFRGKNVESGNFPEIDIFASDSEDEL
eukprot:CAMPEP_0201721192 /NCGR_PEP_ID=MMETSP0593-20130828/5911_1 /ASSEMBLY_ACC=CAM_ASM_000672 /TAXON_ID=267983 /ORGANISM="Skeletonema japonicum, Strain CCMP2506" /LENGTH=327 /DNA_ID=CAMNT_0048211941 /DNA_START=214 /DNA_END=1197 /DNA_ORIENTATION=-